MERLEYVIVYWILITKIEAILKKKVPKIATGSFKKLWKNKILKILGKKSIGPWLGFEPTVPSLVGQFWSVALTTTPQRRSYRVMSQKYYLSSLVKSLTALWPFVVIQISKCFTFLWSVSNTLQHTCPAPYRPKFEGVYWLFHPQFSNYLDLLECRVASLAILILHNQYVYYSSSCSSSRALSVHSIIFSPLDSPMSSRFIYYASKYLNST